MPSFIKESLVYKIIYKLITAFVSAYNDSLFKSLVADRLFAAWQDSRLHKILSNYADKEPAFENALCYRLVMGIASVLDRFFAWINKILFNALDNSRIWQQVRFFRSCSVRGGLFCVGLLIMSVAVGGVIGACIFSRTGSMEIVLCWGVFALGAVVFLSSVFYEKVVQSGIVRLIKWIIE